MSSTELATDTIHYMMDFLIVQPQDYINIFLVNQHWRESTEKNPKFWMRQLCGLIFIITRDRNSHRKATTQIDEMDFYEFYKTFFFKQSLFKTLLMQNSVLKK